MNPRGSIPVLNHGVGRCCIGIRRILTRRAKYSIGRTGIRIVLKTESKNTPITCCHTENCPVRPLVDINIGHLDPLVIVQRCIEVRRTRRIARKNQARAIVIDGGCTSGHVGTAGGDQLEGFRTFVYGGRIIGNRHTDHQLAVDRHGHIAAAVVDPGTAVVVLQLGPGVGSQDGVARCIGGGLQRQGHASSRRANDGEHSVRRSFVHRDRVDRDCP